jgi:hypothetical protein
MANRFHPPLDMANRLWLTDSIHLYTSTPWRCRASKAGRVFHFRSSASEDLRHLWRATCVAGLLRGVDHHRAFFIKDTCRQQGRVTAPRPVVATYSRQTIALIGQTTSELSSGERKRERESERDRQKERQREREGQTHFPESERDETQRDFFETAPFHSCLDSEPVQVLCRICWPGFQCAWVPCLA